MMTLLQYRQAVKSPPPLALQQKQRSFLTFGFGAGPARRESHVNVNVTPTSHDLASDTPEIRKYKKRFNSEILCAALWGESGVSWICYSEETDPGESFKSLQLFPKIFIRSMSIFNCKWKCLIVLGTDFYGLKISLNFLQLISKFFIFCRYFQFFFFQKNIFKNVQIFLLDVIRHKYL